MSKGTTPRAIRLDNDLWRAAIAKSKRTGTPVSDVVRERLEQWITEDDTPNGDAR